jgi:hypothetical protein
MHGHPVPDCFIHRVEGRLPDSRVNTDICINTCVVKDIYGEHIILVSFLQRSFLPEYIFIQNHFPGSPPFPGVPEEVYRSLCHLVHFGKCRTQIIESERECSNGHIMGFDILSDLCILPPHLNTGIVRMTCPLHSLPENGEHPAGRVESGYMSYTPRQGDREPPRPGPHIKNRIFRKNIDETEIAFCGCTHLPADMLIGGSTLVPDTGRIAILPGTFRRGRVNRFPEFVPVDDPLHGRYFYITWYIPWLHLSGLPSPPRLLRFFWRTRCVYWTE